MRLIVSILGGTLIALALFAFGDTLISDTHLQELAPDRTVRLEFIRPTPDERVFAKERQRPQKAPPPTRPPPVARIAAAPPARVAPLPVAIEMPDIAVPVASGFGPYLGTWTDSSADQAGPQYYDGDLVPLVQVSPRYPRQAEAKGIEGWVDVEFTIRADGTVTDAFVLEADPPAVFDRSAINAIKRWKFKPRVVDGRAVESRGRQLISFDLIESG